MKAKTKRIFKNILLFMLHIIVALAIMFIADVLTAIADDLISGWSLKAPVLSLIAFGCIVIYWVREWIIDIRYSISKEDNKSFMKGLEKEFKKVV